jgi:DNA-binding NtrC family response regulator
MPAMDGWQTLRAARELVPGLPVILAGGEGPGAPPSSGEVPSGVFLLRKPFALDELLDMVGRALAGSAAAGDKLGNT